MRTNRLLLLYILISFSGILFSQDIENIAKEKPVTFHGDIGLNLMAYGVNGIPARQSSFSYILAANATVSLYGFEFPFAFVFSDKQRSYAQSFNEFGISPKYKWITLHAGYRNVTFSNYTLAGHTFFGAGIELNPGIFRFGFIYGRFMRETSGSPVFETDPLPEFKRKGFAVKLGVGSENNFLDLLFLRIRDDSTSLHQRDTGAIRTPEQNVVAGINSHFTFFKKLVWEVEGAVSLYTTNMWASPSLDSSTAKILKRMNKFFVINQSSEYYTAFRTSLKYKAKNWSLKLEYKHIDPNYRSMGAYFFPNDLQNITIGPSFTIFKRKLAISGSVGLQRDNLAGTKRATSLQTIGNVNVSCNPSSTFGVDASYGNYSYSQRDGRLPLNDTTKVHQTNQNFSLMPRLLFMNTEKSHMVMLVYNLSNFTDHNAFSSNAAASVSQTAQLSYVLGLIKTNWSFNFGLTYLSVSTCLTDNTSRGGTFGISKSLVDNKISLSWNNSLMYSKQAEDKAWIWNSNVNGNYRINRHHSMKLNLFFTGNYTNSGSQNPSFNEFKGDLGYVYTF